MTKQGMFDAGVKLLERFAKLNNITMPGIVHEPVWSQFRTCAYYRDSVIYIDVPHCSALGTSGRCWSAPGYIVDRTPYGVLAHEFGHHVDRAHGTRRGQFSPEIRAKAGESGITTYAETNTNEWFAEAFRLYMANPELLYEIRPNTCAALGASWQIVEDRDWREVIRHERQIKAAENRIKRGK